MNTITSNAMTETVNEKEELGIIIWEIYKDVYGMRPRWMDFQSMTLEEMNGIIVDLKKEMERTISEEKLMEEEAMKEFTQVIDNVIHVCGCDFKTAIDHLMVAEGTDNMEYFFWLQNIGYENADILKKRYQS